jgi:hypothetical protein
MFKQGYYPTFCIAPLFLACERLEALTAFSKLAFRLSDGNMSMHICSMHISVLFASEQSSWQLVSRLIALVCFTIDGIEGCTICNASVAGTYHHDDSGISTEHFEHICRPTPLPSRKKHKTARPHLNTHLTNQQGIASDIFLIHYGKVFFGGGHNAYECLEYL